VHRRKADSRNSEIAVEFRHFGVREPERQRIEESLHRELPIHEIPKRSGPSICRGRVSRNPEAHRGFGYRVPEAEESLTQEVPGHEVPKRRRTRGKRSRYRRFPKRGWRPFRHSGYRGRKGQEFRILDSRSPERIVSRPSWRTGVEDLYLPGIRAPGDQEGRSCETRSPDSRNRERRSRD
jgi:hypothetical protein